MTPIKTRSGETPDTETSELRTSQTRKELKRECIEMDWRCQGTFNVEISKRNIQVSFSGSAQGEREEVGSAKGIRTPI